ncbi:aspartyl/glutamyl-tRNA(Asn/Gln) amidotransferasesubunit B [Striga asiatica]|uniref:Aspartyl/glutamyl-tRNA(Asn/Gln) amidotransferasesubunit B n=1 Tax=Striga asiatica TaxID=4170 RepID=A0A5A7QG27_STRAF|nr:aspartyl/glutamyl-tRNA(Asn/Gln) amidotransferasesubunit B [Striga asiatica]
MFLEIAVRPPNTDMIKEDRINMFLRPIFESARVESTSPPTRQPNKKDDEGRPLVKGLAHRRDHSDTVDACTADSSLHNKSRLVVFSHGKLVLLWFVQLHLGFLSVKTAMKVCCASKNHANETKVDWKNCFHPKLPKYCSIGSSRERSWWCTNSCGGGFRSPGIT